MRREPIMNVYYYVLLILAIIAITIIILNCYEPDQEMQKLRKWQKENRAEYAIAYPMYGNDLYWHAHRIGAIDTNILQKAKEVRSLHRAHQKNNKQHLIKDPEYYANMSVEDVAMHLAGFRMGRSYDYEYRLQETSRHSRNKKKRYVRVAYFRYMTSYAQVIYMPPQRITKRQSMHLDRYCLKIAYDSNNPKDYIILNK